MSHSLGHKNHNIICWAEHKLNFSRGSADGPTSDMYCVHTHMQRPPGTCGASQEAVAARPRAGRSRSNYIDSPHIPLRTIDAPDRRQSHRQTPASPQGPDPRSHPGPGRSIHPGLRHPHPIPRPLLLRDCCAIAARLLRDCCAIAAPLLRRHFLGGTPAASPDRREAGCHARPSPSGGG